MAGLVAIWPIFDAAKPRVDRACVPWEEFRDVAVEVDTDAMEMLRKTKPDSYERSQEIQRLTVLLHQQAYGLWDSAVRHALTTELATMIQAACKLVCDSGNAMLGVSLTARVSDSVWSPKWDAFNAAVVALGDVRPLIRRAVHEVRLGAEKSGSPSSEVPVTATPPPAGKLRLVLDREKTTVRLDDGPVLPLTTDMFNVFVVILTGRGQYVKEAKIRSECLVSRPGRVIDRLPADLHRLIESKEGPGGGHRIDPTTLDIIGP